MNKMMVCVMVALALAGCVCTDKCAKDGPVSVLELVKCPGPGKARNGEGDMIRLKDGRVMLAYTEFLGNGAHDHHPAHIVACYSSDGGNTWTEPVEIIEREGKMNTMSVSLMRISPKRIAIFYLRKNSDYDCRPMVRFSDDEGKTWSSPRCTIPDSRNDYYVLNNCRAQRLKSGRIVLPVCRHSFKEYGKNALAEGRLSCVFSDDAGESWQMGKEYIVYDNNGKRVVVQEPGVIELKDGRLYMHARTDRGRQWQAFSTDGGVTWKDFGPSPLYGPCGPATIIRLRNGDLMVAWNDHEGHPEYNLRPGWGRVPLTLAISRDEGKTWIKRRVIEGDLQSFYCYFSILELDGYVLLHYYCKPWLADGRVTKVSLDWLYSSED